MFRHLNIKYCYATLEFAQFINSFTLAMTFLFTINTPYDKILYPPQNYIACFT